jgi:hypothetical protein
VGAGASVFIASNAEHGIRNIGKVPLLVLYTFAADSMDAVQSCFSSSVAASASPLPAEG